jgi:hypothetical protein
MNIIRLIDSSYNAATKALVMGTSKRSLARARERAFVKTLISQLQREFDGADMRVFASSQRGNAAAFGVNQLLYDIAVCRIGTGKKAARKPEDFYYIAQALWQIEVEFSREWRHALFAINRLNCGAAADKLLITSKLGREQEPFLNTIAVPVAAGGGVFYLAAVPNPADWDDDAGAPQVWRIASGMWEEIT